MSRSSLLVVQIFIQSFTVDSRTIVLYLYMKMCVLLYIANM